MTHLAIITLDFVPDIGGVQQYLYEIANRLGNHHQISVITPIKGARVAPSVQLIAPSSTSSLSFLHSLRQLSPDKVLVGHTHPRLLLAALLATRGNYAALAYGNDFLAAQSRWHSPLFNALLSRARPLITISQSSAARLQQLQITKPLIVYPGTDPDRFTPSYDQSGTSLTLLTLSRLVPRKGIDTVLQTLPKLLNEFPHLRYHIAGSGPERARLEQIVQDLKITYAVKFLGRIPERNLVSVYQNADIFVMPSREVAEVGSIEGFGIVYLEANACGLPVIASNSGGAIEAVRDGETGLLVPPDNPALLGQALRQLLQDAELRRQLGKNGRNWVEAEMNWDRAAQQLAETLQL